MKKNWTVKVAALMLALTMITACFVGSTFAKYVTKAQGEGQARVAKWGILLTMNGAPFATQYETHDDDYKEDGGEYSVVSANTDYVVAPGTSSEDDDVGGNMVASVTGTPEVAARYTLEGSGLTDVVLKKGTYTDYTNLVMAQDGSYGYTDTFTLDKDYAPIKWNLKISGKGAEYDLVTLLYDNLPAANIAQAEAYGLTREGCSIFAAIAIIQKVAGNQGYINIVEAALSQVVSGGRNFMLEADAQTGTFKMSYDFDPNKPMDYTFELSWAWAFEQTDVELYDKADTYIGNVAAGVITDANCTTTISAAFTATATQID